MYAMPVMMLSCKGNCSLKDKFGILSWSYMEIVNIYIVSKECFVVKV